METKSKLAAARGRETNGKFMPNGDMSSGAKKMFWKLIKVFSCMAPGIYK